MLSAQKKTVSGSQEEGAKSCAGVWFDSEKESKHLLPTHKRQKRSSGMDITMHVVLW